MSKLDTRFIREQLVPTLKSGKYKQGTRALRKGDNFCCLGVICDLKKTEIGADWTDGGEIGRSLFLGEEQFLPDQVAESVGLTRSGNYLLPDGSAFWDDSENPVYLNDHYTQFPAIAKQFLRLCDYVEAQEAGAPS